MKKQHPRAPRHRPLTPGTLRLDLTPVSLPNARFQAEVRDLSTTGLQIETSFPLVPNDEVMIRIGDANGSRLVKATVCWVVAPDSPHRTRAGCRLV